MKQLVFSFKEKSIKAALVEQRGNTYNLLNAASAELAAGAIETGAIKNYDEVKAKLSELVGNTSEARSHHIFILLAEEALVKLLRDPNYSGDNLNLNGAAVQISVQTPASAPNQRIIGSVAILDNIKRRVEVSASFTNNVLTVNSWKETP